MDHRKRPSINVSSPPPSVTRSPFRRRRLLWISVSLLALFIYLVPWDLPSFDPSVPALSRANIASLVRPGRYEPDEIWGLLHMVTSEEPILLGHGSEVGEGEQRPVDMDKYAGVTVNDKVDWKRNVKVLKEKYPVVVFSKTYCPYSKKAKALLETYSLRPQPKIVEVDLRDDGPLLKSILTRLSSRATFPNVFVHGVSIGGYDNLAALHEQGKLVSTFEKAGVKVTGEVATRAVED
ncbi:hypothetical protein PLICRDRAFT_172636 [Plicaturopsis crispa FD-325 SS-3]|nr:hypothetical protein PLICRDRAFT_172636 [Plicaturopsis crispa FD-325 SS-3]